MDNSIKPLVVLFGYRDGNQKIVFVGRQGDIILEMDKYQDDFLNILKLCNGRRDFASIKSSIKNLDDQVFFELMRIAEEFEIIVDSRSLYLNFHKDSSNPLRFSQKIGPYDAAKLAEDRPSISPSEKAHQLPLIRESASSVFTFCSARRSSRSFSGANLSVNVINELLRSMYTVGSQRSTPSAGQLYPLSIYIALLKNSDNLEKGLYQYDPEKFILNLIQGKLVSENGIAHVLDSYIADGSGAVIFIAADLARPAKKYANRGYRFALLECGHAAQNAYLYCVENNLGIVEYGGFQDESAAKLLGLQYPDQSVLSALVIGHEDINATGKPRSYAVQAWDLQEALVGENKPVEYLIVNTPMHGAYTLPYIQILAKYRQEKGVGKIPLDEKNCFGSGLAVVSDEAMVKAIAEAYERYASGLYRTDVISTASDLQTKWLNPDVVVPVTPEARNRYGWQQFNHHQVWQWVNGASYATKEEVLVPVDLVFYPLSEIQVGRRLCYASNSSGVAAHFDYEIAVEKAVLELIERDAFAVTWYSERRVNAIPYSFLSADIQLRMDHWIKSGWNVKVLDITIDSVPVILVLIHSGKKYPSFVAGASAHPDWNTATVKAWDEAEIFLMNWIRKRPKIPSVNDVVAPLHHGLIYFNNANLSRVNWLLDSKEVEPKQEQYTERKAFLAQFDPIIVDIAKAGNKCDLNVVRALSSKLLPLNFGYGNEHRGHQRMSDLGLEWKHVFPSFPHFFA